MNKISLGPGSALWEKGKKNRCFPIPRIPPGSLFSKYGVPPPPPSPLPDGDARRKKKQQQQQPRQQNKTHKQKHFFPF